MARLWRPVLLADAAACCRMQLHAAACCCMQPRASDTREADGAVQWQVLDALVAGWRGCGGLCYWRMLLRAAACSCMLLHAAACSRVPATPERQMALSNGRFWTLWWQVGEAVEACATGGLHARRMQLHAAACCCMQPRASDTREADGAVRWQVLDALVAGGEAVEACATGGCCCMLPHAAACCCMLLHAAACSRVPATPERQMALSNGRFWTLWWQVGEAVEAFATGGCCCMQPRASDTREADAGTRLHAAACSSMQQHAAACGSMQQHPPVAQASDAAACCRMQLHAAACCCMQPRASDTREADGVVQWQVLDALVAGWRGCGGLCYWRMLLHAAACSCMLLHAAACSRVPATPERQMALSNGRFWTLWWQVGEAVEACATGGCCCMLPHAAACCCMLLRAAACQRHPRGRWRCPMAGFGRFGGRLARLWRHVLLADAAACCRMQLHAAACCCMQPRASDTREADAGTRLHAAACSSMQLHAAACSSIRQ